MRRSGMSENAIREALLQQGWQLLQVDELLGKKEIQASTEKASVVSKPQAALGNPRKTRLFVTLLGVLVIVLGTLGYAFFVKNNSEQKLENSNTEVNQVLPVDWKKNIILNTDASVRFTYQVPKSYLLYDAEIDLLISNSTGSTPFGNSVTPTSSIYVNTVDCIYPLEASLTNYPLTQFEETLESCHYLTLEVKSRAAFEEQLKQASRPMQVSTPVTSDSVVGLMGERVDSAKGDFAQTTIFWPKAGDGKDVLVLTVEGKITSTEALRTLSRDFTQLIHGNASPVPSVSTFSSWPQDQLTSDETKVTATYRFPINFVQFQSTPTIIVSEGLFSNSNESEISTQKSNEKNYTNATECEDLYNTDSEMFSDAEKDQRWQEGLKCLYFKYEFLSRASYDALMKSAPKSLFTTQPLNYERNQGSLTVHNNDDGGVGILLAIWQTASPETILSVALNGPREKHDYMKLLLQEIAADISFSSS